MTFLVSYTNHPHGPDHAVYVRAFHDIDEATRFIAAHTHLPASSVDLELRLIRNRVELLQVTHESRRLHSTLIVTATPTATDQETHFPPQETTDKHAR